MPSLDDDRIIRRFRNVIDNVLRTNFFQHGHIEPGDAKPYIAIKLDCGKLDELPAPRPWREIFVYAPAMEGVHLRFGRIARGGIRWSDRREDFRTEILGLVKAQQVKNAVIVPVGAKGGFFPKAMPAAPTREQFMAIGIAAYQTLINAMLDVTDNLKPDGSVVPPRACQAPGWRRSLSGGGGRQGHGHLFRHRQRHRRGSRLLAGRCFRLAAAAMAMTTRKWASPHAAPGKRSSAISASWAATFRPRISPSSASATCRATCSATACCCPNISRLVAAFDHRHIFLDPKGDPATSFAERKRLFALPRSSWDDYNKDADRATAAASSPAP